MLRGWIEIQLTNGQRFKYVRDVTFRYNGDTIGDSDSIFNALYYEYGDTVGDTLLYQGDSIELLGNFVSLKTDYESASAYDFLSFPESAGDTTILIRPNFDMPETSPPQENTGDTIKAYRWATLSIESIVSINIVETFAPPINNIYVP